MLHFTYIQLSAQAGLLYKSVTVLCQKHSEGTWTQMQTLQAVQVQFHDLFDNGKLAGQSQESVQSNW